MAGFNGPMQPHLGQDPADAFTDAEYRIEELAAAAGTTVRNVRAYRDRGLLPPPRREGRLAFYGPAHLARLRLIAALVERGYNLANVGELLEAWHQGRDLGEMLGLESVIAGAWVDERPATVTTAALRLALATTPGVRREGLDALVAEVVAEAGVLGVVHRDPAGAGDVQVDRPRLLEAGLALVQAGVPVAAVSDLARRLDQDVDRLAGAFVDVVVEHVVEPMAADAGPEEVARLAGLVTRLRPLALRVVAAELGRALQRRVHDELGEQLTRLAAAAGTPGTAGGDGEADVSASSVSRPGRRRGPARRRPPRPAGGR
jgi:DNA-binding transcriptional MerR regulator